MALKLDPSLAFDRGIERIIGSDQREATLPDAAHLPPSDSAAKPELEKLLALPNLEDYVAQDLMPEVRDRSMLTPQGFGRALGAAIATLRGAASSAAGAARPRLARAAGALQQESELRELADHYRNALLQG
jgi:hypothetical protein